MSDVKGEKPLHGSSFVSFKITSEKLLAHRWYGFEYGLREVATTQQNEEYPGINHVNLYQDNYPWPEENKGPTLERALALNSEHPMRFLISKVGNRAIVSSQIGYLSSTRVVNIPEAPTYYAERSPVSSVELVDYLDPMGEQYLMTAHLGRVSLAGGDVSVELPQNEADAIFRFMVSGCGEIR